MTARSFFYRETDGIRVTVRPVYLRDHSEPSQSHYVFAYFVRIENVGTMAAQLLTRRHRPDVLDAHEIGEHVMALRWLRVIAEIDGSHRDANPVCLPVEEAPGGHTSS